MKTARFGASQNTWPNSGFDPATGIVSGGWKSLVTLAYDEVVDMDPASFSNGYKIYFSSAYGNLF